MKSPSVFSLWSCNLSRVINVPPMLLQAYYKAYGQFTDIMVIDLVKVFLSLNIMIIPDWYLWKKIIPRGLLSFPKLY